MSNPDNNEQKRIRSTRPFLRRAWALLINNWGWKLGCLAIAILLWGGLIMQDATLMRSKVFNDVTISVNNEDTLLRNGYIVVSGLSADALTGVRMRVDVPQRMYDSVQASRQRTEVLWISPSARLKYRSKNMRRAAVFPYVSRQPASSRTVSTPLPLPPIRFTWK